MDDATDTTVFEPLAEQPTAMRFPSLFIGVVFLTIGLVAMFGDIEDDAEWVWIAAVGAAGLAGLSAAVAALRR